MKKLTAGIFATILGVTAMGAADAAVTSKGYVDEAVKTVAGSVTALSTTVSNTYATKDALAGEVTARTNADATLQTNIDTLAGNVYKKTETYTQAEVDAAIAAVDGAESVQALTGRVTTAEGEIDALQTKTAGYGDIVTHNASEFATAAQGATADSTAATVAGYGDIVTHNVAEFATAAQGAKADTALQPAAINDMATQTWVEGKGYLTEHQSLAEYAKTADVNAELELKATKAELNNYATTSALTTGLAGKQANLSDTQLQAVNSGITAGKIATMDQATAAAQGDATQALADAATAQAAADAAQADANTNAAAITNLEAFDNSIKTATENAADGTYALTMKKNAQTGAMEFDWELIQRDGAGK